ncbi:hypothetical protein EDB84DRAFT_266334 [Lactarius hengduanensis]|nr:hypothetical protein EDB84DRAFT_266334 [Lactarius hengduanensis]
MIKPAFRRIEFMRGIASARDAGNCGHLVQDCVNAGTMPISNHHGVIGPPGDKSGNQSTSRETPYEKTSDKPGWRRRSIERRNEGGRRGLRVQTVYSRVRGGSGLRPFLLPLTVKQRVLRHMSSPSQLLLGCPKFDGPHYVVRCQRPERRSRANFAHPMLAPPGHPDNTPLYDEVLVFGQYEASLGEPRSTPFTPRCLPTTVVWPTPADDASGMHSLITFQTRRPSLVPAD